MIERIALLGMSMGGYLAPRAAAFDHRIAACVAYDGVLNMAAAILGPQPPEVDSEQRVAAMDSLIANRVQAPSSLRWGISNALWVFSGATTHELIDEISKYDDLTEVAGQISCPTLVCEAENDHFFSGQPRMLYEAPALPENPSGVYCRRGRRRALPCGSADAVSSANVRLAR